MRAPPCIQLLLLLALVGLSLLLLLHQLLLLLLQVLLLLVLAKQVPDHNEGRCTTWASTGPNL